MIRKTLVSITLLLSVFLAGCVEMMMEVAANSLPTYDETIKKWPKIPSNQGRIVLFTPTKNPAFSYCEIMIDEVNHYTGMIEGTFIFVDVKEGVRTLTCANNDYPSLNLDMKSGDVAYIKKFKSINGKSPLIVVEKQNVYDNLKNVNHAFENAIPYDKQPRIISYRGKS